MKRLDLKTELMAVDMAAPYENYTEFDIKLWRDHIMCDLLAESWKLMRDDDASNEDREWADQMYGECIQTIIQREIKGE